MRERYGAEPGFITMNLPRAARRRSTRSGSRTRSSARNINKIGFRMCGGVEAYERALREREFRAIAMSVFASGAIPPRGGDRVGLRAAESAVDRLRRLERAQHPRHAGARRPVLATLTTLLVASTGGHLKQLHQLHRRLTTISGPYVWATFDTPQSRSLLEGEEVEFVPLRRRPRPSQRRSATCRTRGGS